MFELTDRVVIVVGGAGYLGSAVCRGLLAQGAHVVVADLDGAKAMQLAAGLSAEGATDRCRGVSFDLREEASIAALVDGVRAEFGQLDVLVNATYAPHGAPLHEITAEDFTRSLGINVTGSFLLARHAREAMTSRGSMVFFSSMYGRVAPDPGLYEKPMEPNPIEYGVSKAGIDQMIRYLAVRWAPDGIRVNGICPGAFPHPSVQETHPRFAKRLAAKVPMGRVGRQEEVVGTVVYLASDAASYVTGQIIVVDGGWTVL
ncbi:MAG: SDR family oxidoreductase [Anaerolineae bacterium]|nr:SDR family oxidoreductase [Anaerolineae bacterium]